MYDYLKRLETFDEQDLPSLREVVLGALELFIKNGMSDVKIEDFKKPVIVGSGNAIASAKIIYANKDCIFADENNFEEAFKRDGVDGVVIFNASGAKHGPIIAKAAVERGMKTQLVTCAKNSPAEQIVGSTNTIVSLKNREPYTYNTSTYMGWILSIAKEDPKVIYDFLINDVANYLKDIDFSKYDGFLLATPNQYPGVKQLFEVKFTELFGRIVARDVKTFEELKHAVTVVPSKTELAIKFGTAKIDFENDVIEIPMPNELGAGFLMAIGYFVIGHIQEQHPQYFKENIKSYIQRLNETEFGKGMKVIVE
ncbi:hypothetical protein KBD45_01260 [Candidatus Dojkabacteria bacterium]|nr:hypothetical protein [Candidatus Dojkabacteria bacterium]